MKKTILIIVLVVGITLTVGNSSRLVAGDRVSNVVSQLLATYCRVSRVTPGRDDSNLEKNKNKCNTLNIDWDVILNLFAEYFACIEDNGNNECAVNYCRCTLETDEDFSSADCRTEFKICAMSSINKSKPNKSN